MDRDAIAAIRLLTASIIVLALVLLVLATATALT